MIASDRREHLSLFGYIFLPGWVPDRPTLQLAKSIGTTVDVPTLLPGSRIPAVQMLEPRQISELYKNQYSGTYGVGGFPLHTDLAHWARPPRYLMLRCISGSPDVNTWVVPASALESIVGRVTMRQAVTRPRRPGALGTYALLPLLFQAAGAMCFRWDPLFLVPMNSAAQRVAEATSTYIADSMSKLVFTLAHPGDTLVVDNWRMLHGWGSVPPTSMNRRIERVYLTEILA